MSGHRPCSQPYESKFTVLTLSLSLTVVIILSLIDQINYIDEQERVRLLREDFSYAMVHDMKSPLTSIIMGTKYLHSGVLEKKPEMKEKYFCIVEDEAQHLLAHQPPAHHLETGARQAAYSKGGSKFGNDDRGCGG